MYLMDRLSFYACLGLGYWFACGAFPSYLKAQTFFFAALGCAILAAGERAKQAQG